MKNKITAPQMLQVTLLIISVRAEYKSRLKRKVKQAVFDDISLQIKNLLKQD